MKEKEPAAHSTVADEKLDSADSERIAYVVSSPEYFLCCSSQSLYEQTMKTSAQTVRTRNSKKNKEYRYRKTPFYLAIAPNMDHLAMFPFFLLATTAALLIITTPKTSFDISATLESSRLASKYRVLTAEEYFSGSLLGGELVLDYSYDPRVTLALPETQTVVMWPSRISRNFALYQRDYELRFTLYLRAMNLTKVTVLSDHDGLNLIEEFPDVYVDVIFFPLNASIEFTTEIARRVIKPSGKTVFAVFLQERTTFYFLQALESAKLNKAGFVFILSETSSYYQGLCGNCSALLRTGALCIVPAFRASARSEAEAQAAVLASISRSEVYSPATILAVIDTSLVVVNLVNSRAVVVAESFRQAETFTGVFPGGVTTLPKGSKLSIMVSINYFAYVNGSDIPTAGPTMRGCEVAFQEKQESTSLLPNFDLDVQPLNLQSYTLNATFVQELASMNLNRLGLVHFPIGFSPYLNTTYTAFRSLNLNVPMSSTFADVELSRPAEYPLALSVLTSSDYFAFATMRIISRYGWKRMAVIYGAGGDSEAIYRGYLKYAKVYGVTFTNSEASRGLTQNIANGPTAEINATLTEIMHSSARIILLMHVDTGSIYEAMYDIGIRNEYLLLTSMIPSRSSFQNAAPNIAKRLAVAHGALVINPRAFIGEVGQKAYRELEAKDGPDTFDYSCFYYDAVMLYLHAADYMVSQGLDYEDAGDIMKAMRGTHFAGCGGLVHISPGSNVKPEAEFAVKNFRYYEGNRSIEIQDVMFFNPFSSILLKDVSPILWPDGTYNYWNDTLDLPCPFKNSEVRLSSAGFSIIACVSLGVLLLATAASVYSWKQWRSVHYGVLASQEELSWEDIVQMAAVPLEALQIAVIGPEPADLNGMISSAAGLISLQLSALIGTSGEVFWETLYFAFGLVGGYILVCVVLLTSLEKRLEWVPLLPFLLLFIKLLLPAASTLLFIPVVSSLLQVFQCQSAVGSSLSDSYMDSDCNTWCWQGSHLLFVAEAAVALVLFIPVIVLSRPSWQDNNETLHVKMYPVSSAVKSVFQALLVGISHLLKREYEDAHAGVHLSVLAAYIAYMIKFPVYNYHRYHSHRLNLWTTIMALITLAFSVLAMTSRLLPSSRAACLSAFYTFTGALILIGLLLQRFVGKFKSLLRRKRVDESKLFRFAFSFGTKSRYYLPPHSREPCNEN